MNEIITTWMIAKKSYQTPKEQPQSRDPNAMEVGALSSHWQPYGKGDGKSGKSYGKSQGKGGKSYGKSYGKGDGKGGKSYGKSGGKGGKSYGKSYGKGGKSYGKSDGKSYGKGPSSSFMVGAFHGYCGGCWEWGHKKAHCPSRSSRMEIGAVAGSSTAAPSSARSATAFSEVGTSVSQRIQAVSSSALLDTWDEEDWPDETYGWWTEDWPEPWWDEWAEEDPWHDDWELREEELYVMTLRDAETLQLP
jgi:hypothetical protein